MMQSLRDRKREDGFTLIELMVVVLIIAILIAIAIPTFLGARERAEQKAAQSGLRNSLTAAKTIATDTNSYASVDSTSVQAAEPSLTFVAAGTNSTAETEVSVSPVSATVWVAAALSDDGTCYFIKDNTAGPGTTYAKQADGSANCNATWGNTNGTFTATGWQ